MKSDKYKNCAVIYRKILETKIDYKYLYCVCFYDKNGYSNWHTKDTGNEVRLYKTLKGAERACKKYRYDIIVYDDNIKEIIMV